MSQFDELYQKLTHELRESSVLSTVSSVLGWDEQTYMPDGGAEHRSEQSSLMAGLIHDRQTLPERGALIGELEACSENATPEQQANIREARRDFDHATLLPRELVKEMSRVTSLAQQAWVKARKSSDFSQFLPWLDQVVNLKQQEAECIGYKSGVRYDALLEHYEPGTTTAEVSTIFSALRSELVELVQDIQNSGVEPPREVLTRDYPVEKQAEFGKEAAAAIGFNFERGRIDIAAHPFCSTFGPGDCRLTTRYNPNFFSESFFGTLHEAGHGIYEQGLNEDEFGTAMGSYTSLGIHESQSRLWENFVGRSKPFWQHFFPKAQSLFANSLADVTLDQFYAAVNDVHPSFIRVEADEATYNLHIMLRFEIEQLLVSGEIKAADVPTVWNEEFEKSFQMKVPDDTHGCLQDIHWSIGAIGYFATYALGNMYAAQLFDTAKAELGDLNQQFVEGQFGPLKEWLNKNIHARGRQYWAGELTEVVTGKPLSHKPLMNHLRSKYNELYQL